MKKVLFILAFVLALLAGSDVASARAVKKVYHFADTVKSQKKRDNFMLAIKQAPDVFVYREMIWKNDHCVTVAGMNFNQSITNTLASPFCENDPKLAKNLKRVGKIVKPLNAVIDLTVDFHMVPKGIAVAYTIDHINIYGKGKVPDDSELKKNRKD